MNDLTDQARAILDAGRHLDNPSGVARERARKAVLARIATAGAVVAAASLPSGAAAVTLPLVKILLPTVLVVAASGVGGGLWWRAAHRPEAAPPAVTATRVVPAARVVAPPPPVAIPEPQPVAEPPPAHAQRSKSGKAKPAAARRLAAAAPPGDSLQDETALLARVNAALRGGDARQGLALLDEYDQQFPRGILHEETTATRIIARCQAAEAAAPAAARQFIQAHPRSPLSSRVRSSCLIEPGR